MKEERALQYKMIGLNIAYYRKLRGMSQLELATAVGISRNHMSNIETPNKPTSLSLEVLLDIAEALRISAKSLLTFEEEMLK